MLQPNRESAPLQHPETGLVVDFEAAKARRHERRLAEAEGPAIRALAAYDAGRGSFWSALAELIAPFNRDPI